MIPPMAVANADDHGRKVVVTLNGKNLGYWLAADASKGRVVTRVICSLGIGMFAAAPDGRMMPRYTVLNGAVEIHWKAEGLGGWAPCDCEECSHKVVIH